MTRYEKEKLIERIEKLEEQIEELKEEAKDRYDLYAGTRWQVKAANVKRDVDYRIGQLDILKVVKGMIRDA